MRNSHISLRSRGLLLAAAAVVGGTLTACGSGDDSKAAADDTPSAAAASKSAAASRPVYDPPAKFDTTGAPMPEGLTDNRTDLQHRVIRSLPVTLHGGTAYAAAFDHVQAVDTATGDITATIEPEGTAAVEGTGITHDAGPPALVTTGDKSTLLTPFLVRQAGTGTQAAHQAVEMAVSDADTAKVLWRMTLRLPEWGDDTLTALTVHAVGADGNIGVVTAHDSYDNAATYGIDLVSHRQVWSQDGFAAAGIADGTAVGSGGNRTGEGRALGYDAATGKRLWQGAENIDPDVTTAGPHYAVARAKDFKTDEQTLLLVDPATGATKHRLPAELGESTCGYDEKSTIVCHGESTQTDEPVAYGLDATSGKVLWKLPDAQSDRIAPEVTSAWHGRVYGETENGPVTLDARTGEDAPTSPGIAPVLVNGSAALALKQVDGWKYNLFVYAATG
ncbi:PQQ-binding-like beta-propeller repeat protein [Streptomyces sp. NPDC006602]|uniref:outer membrane protein assembly factor BamB family protein n=1 Tax=Streptomyces sp. NPDC006602 TaxID=3364751 RepID=UPI0036C90106